MSMTVHPRAQTHLQPGDSFPNVSLNIVPSDGNLKSTLAAIRNSRVLIFTLPCPFSQESQEHYKQFVQSAFKIFTMKIDKIICLLSLDNVQDTYLSRDSNIECWLDVDDLLSSKLGIGSCNYSIIGIPTHSLQRATMIIDNQKVEWIQVELNSEEKAFSTTAEQACTYLRTKDVFLPHVNLKG